MLSKNTIKYLNSLKEKKYRDLKNEFIVEGEKSVYEFLKYPENIKAIYALPAWINQNIEKLKLINNINEISVDLLKKISNLKTPNNVIAIVKKTHSTIDFNHNNLILVLDGIRDPGNIGTIIRIADWFGIDYLICSPDTVDPYNPKAVQSSMGSLCRVKVLELPLDQFFNMLPHDFMVYGTLINATPINNIKLQQKAVIIIGNEAKGISNNIIKFVSCKISIPSYMHELKVKGKADSLNAAIAASILCYEFKKQNNNNS